MCFLWKVVIWKNLNRKCYLTVSYIIPFFPIWIWCLPFTTYSIMFGKRFKLKPFFSQMDPNVLNLMNGVPLLGRGRSQQLQEQALWRSTVLPATEEPRVGQARGFLPSDNTLPGRGVTLPVSQTMFGQGRGLLSQPDVGVMAGCARGLLLPPPEPKVGLARGALLSSLEPPQGQTPRSEATAREPTNSLSTKEV